MSQLEFPLRVEFSGLLGSGCRLFGFLSHRGKRRTPRLCASDKSAAHVAPTAPANPHSAR